MPGATRSFLLLVAMSFVASSFLLLAHFPSRQVLHEIDGLVSHCPREAGGSPVTSDIMCIYIYTYHYE